MARPNSSGSLKAWRERQNIFWTCDNDLKDLTKGLLWVNEKSRWSHQMPLPNLNRQCSARARSTGNRCLNPAAFGCKTCRYHGARRRETVKVGKDHPQYLHGERTREAIQKYRTTMAELQTLEKLGIKAGVLIGPPTSGRRNCDQSPILEKV